VHQPGVVPLRPLTLGDLFGGATLTIRRNPRATVGLAALVTLGFMLLPIVVTLVLGLTDALPSLDLGSGTGSDSQSGFGINIASGISAIFSWLAGVVVTGLIMRVVECAVVGTRISAGQAWQRSRARLLPLLGLSLLALVVLVLALAVPAGLGVLVGVLASSTPLAVGLGILGFLLGAVGSVFVYVRYFLLAAPNLVIEGNGVLASLRRAGELSRAQFWRLLGISLLAGLLGGIVGQIVAIPFTVLGVVGLLVLPSSWGTVALLMSSYLASVVTGAVTSPFTGGVTALQYYDQRFRKEGHDIELLNRPAGPQA
jgi:hypothetical protein